MLTHPTLDQLNQLVRYISESKCTPDLQCSACATEIHCI